MLTTCLYLLIWCAAASALVEVNEKWEQVIPKKKPPLLDTIVLEQLESITGMFPGCNLYILTPAAHIARLDKVAQPRLYYTDYQQYTIDYFLKPGAGTPLMPFAPQTWRPASIKSYCKAEIAVDWIVGGGSSAFPARSIEDYFTVELKNDPNWTYQVLVGFEGATYPKSMFRWDVFRSETSLRFRLSKLARGLNFHLIGHFYFFQYSRVMKRATDEKLMENVLHTYMLTVMESTCVVCRPNDVVKKRWTNTDARDMVAHIRNYANTFGAIRANEVVIRPMMDQSYVFFTALAMETGHYYDSNHKISAEEVVSAKLGGNEAQDLERYWEGRQILARKIVPVLPESALVQKLKQKHFNMTFLMWGDMQRLGFQYANSISEMIIGPGSLKLGVPHTSSWISVGKYQLIFMTCSNVTIKAKTGLLLKPMDTWTWTFLFISTGAACITLQLTLSKRQNMGNLFPLCYMVARILLENFQDISWKLKKWPTAFAIIVGTIALCSITVTNGYRGVLTSDLVMAPDISGPKTFRELLQDGDWEFISYYTTAIIDGVKKERIRNFLTMDFIVGKFNEDVRATDHAIPILRKFNDLTLLNRLETDSMLHKVKHTAEKNFEAPIPCHCNKQAYITLETSITTIALPDSCVRKLNQASFVRGTDHMLPTRLAWTTVHERPGVVWQSLVRLVESGVYKWLNAILRYARTDLVVEGQQVKLKGKEEVVEPLVMATPIVQSAFAVWYWMILVSVLSLVVELAFRFCFVTFSFRTP